MKRIIQFSALLLFSLNSISQSTPKKGFGFSFMANGKDSVFITQFFPNSPAQKAGILAGDELLQVANVSLKGKTVKEVGDILAANENSAVFNISRSGKPVKFTISKAFQYTYDKVCLIGDCVNGAGTALSNITPGTLVKGKFVNGTLVEGKWGLKAKGVNDTSYWVHIGSIKEDRCFTGKFYDSKMPDGGYIYMR